MNENFQITIVQTNSNRLNFRKEKKYSMYCYLNGLKTEDF